MKLTTLPHQAREMLTNTDQQEVQAAKIRAEKDVPKAKKPTGTVAPSASLRQRILSISLFPNPYNRDMVAKYEKD